MSVVIKRDGRKVCFNKNKIINAISESFKDIDKEISAEDFDIINKIADKIEVLFNKSKELDVEEIQDTIEKELMKSKRKDVAKNFIIYREKRTRERNKNEKLMKQMTIKLQASDVQNQNANIDEKSFGGRRGEATSEFMKQYALDYCMCEKSRNNHINNEIYIHDLDHYATGDHNCLSIPFDHLLAEGFKTRQTDIRPAGSINTAFQLVAVIFQLQSLQQFGGVSATHLDWTMVPYVRKSFLKHFTDGLMYIEDGIELSEEGKDFYRDRSIECEEFKLYDKAYKYAIKMTERELKQAVEGMYHNLK